MKADEVIIFSDMDGTLLTDWDLGPYVPAANIEAIKDFMASGGLFSIASGRQYKDTLGFFGGMPFSLPMVQGNGAVLYDSQKGAVIQKSGLPEPIKQESLDYFLKHPGVWLVAADEDEIFQVLTGDSARDAMLTDLKRKAITIEDYLVLAPVKVCFVVMDADRLSPVIEDVHNFASANLFVTAQSSPYIIELLEKSVGKAPAVREALRLSNAEGRKLICIGDYDNDCGMLAMADIAACPSNASQKVLEMAKIVTCSNNEGAVADLIRQLGVL